MNKPVFEDLGLDDGEFVSLGLDKNNDLLVHVLHWTEKNIVITFTDAIRFEYQCSVTLTQLLYADKENDFLKEALSGYFDTAESPFNYVPKDHRYRYFEIMGIHEKPVLRIVAKNATWKFYNEGIHE